MSSGGPAGSYGTQPFSYATWVEIVMIRSKLQPILLLQVVSLLLHLSATQQAPCRTALHQQTPTTTALSSHPVGQLAASRHTHMAAQAPPHRHKEGLLPLLCAHAPCVEIWGTGPRRPEGQGGVTALQRLHRYGSVHMLSLLLMESKSVQKLSVSVKVCVPRHSRPDFPASASNAVLCKLRSDKMTRLLAKHHPRCKNS